MKALVVDDERLARSELKRLLAAFPSVAVVGEAANANQARTQMAALLPDLVFLDIQMPGENGIELLESIEPPIPAVIFTTAYDEHAVKAFELNALDYLLKPVDPSRLADAVARTASRRTATAARTETSPASPDGGEASAPEGTASEAEGGGKGPGLRQRLSSENKVFVREGERCWFVELGQIRLLESEGNYTRVHFGDAHPQLFRSLNAMEERLDPRSFFRANRRQILNLAWIDRIEPWFSGGLLVHLRDGGKVELSRRQAQEFRERMSL